MALQYIGGRYVPGFKGTYDNTQAYEALDVVDNGMGTSYIAKIPVPAGTPLTNTTYWALYGSANGAIINLQNQIDDMNDGTVPGSLQNQIDTLADTELFYLNVKNYGAVGNGVTDDTAAIQACIDDIPGKNKTSILFPTGTYVINGTINITEDSVELFGVGADSVIIRTTQSNTPVFLVHNNSARINGFDAHDLAFSTITNGEIFQIARVSDSSIHSCFITAVKCFVYYGLLGESNMNIWSKVSDIIGDVTVSDSKFINVAYNTNGVHVYNCQINSEHGNTSRFVYVIPFTNIDTIEVKDNLIQRMTRAITIADDNNPSGVLQNFFIEGNIFDGCEGSNISVSATGGASIITRLHINDNWFSCDTSGANNLVFTATTGKITQISIDDNIIVRAQQRAILVQGNGVECIKICANTFNGFNLTAPGSAINSCVTIGGPTTGVIINDNQFSESSDVVAANTYGIYLENGCVGVIINGNNFKGVTTPLSGTPDNAKGNYPATIDT